MSKVLVFGTGGVGCVYAWILQNGGAEVTAVCRSNFEQVKEHGIHIDSKIFGQVHGRPTAVRTVSEAVSHGLGPFDYIVLTSKAFPGTSEFIKDAVGENTAIVLAQNGISIEEEYKKRYPRNTVISGVVYLPTTQVKAGYVEMGPIERLEVGIYPSLTEGVETNGESHVSSHSQAQGRLAKFAAIFTAGGGNCIIHPDIQPARWIKLAMNAAWNPICALTRCDDANYLRSGGPFSRDHNKWPPTTASFLPMSEIYHVMKEVALLAEASGYPNVVTEEVIKKHLERPMKRLDQGGLEPSMLTDVRFNRGIEVDAILVNAVKIADKLGVGDKVPRLKLLAALAKGLNYSIVPDDRWKPIA